MLAWDNWFMSYIFAKWSCKNISTCWICIWFLHWHRFFGLLNHAYCAKSGNKFRQHWQLPGNLLRPLSWKWAKWTIVQAKWTPTGQNVLKVGKTFVEVSKKKIFMAWMCASMTCFLNLKFFKCLVPCFQHSCSETLVRIWLSPITGFNLILTEVTELTQKAWYYGLLVLVIYASVWPIFRKQFHSYVGSWKVLA